MIVATVILVVLALALVLYAAWRQDGSLQKGLSLSWGTTKRSIILLLLAFAIVGYIEVLAPTDLVEAWLGPESGIRGILLAEVLGVLLPGGPYVVFPLISALYAAGAGLAPTVTLITSWATLAMISVTFELPFMGWRFTAVRWGLGLLAPLLAGLAVLALW